MIDPRQRYDDWEAILKLATGENQASIFTALPGIVQAFHGATVDVQLAIGGSQQSSDGSTQATSYPLIHDLPIVWPRGGNVTLTFPIAPGDECLVVFACRAIDAWWQNGGVSQRPLEPRMHDMSDGFALVGPFSQQTKIASVSTSTVQLRSNDGASYIELDPAGHVVNIVAPGGVNITGPVAITGTVMASGAITTMADVTAGTVTLKTHEHSGVQAGSSLSGLPQG